MKMPGFKTNVLWKKIISSIYYLWIILLFMGEFLSVLIYQVSIIYWLHVVIVWMLFGYLMFWLMKELPHQQAKKKQ